MRFGTTMRDGVEGRTEGLANREAWLQACVEVMRGWFRAEGVTVPPVRVSVGFPSKGALSRKRKRIGECWAGSMAADGLPQIFLSPLLGQDDVGHVLMHELVHAAVGCQCGHRGPFARVAKALGLVGPMTATIAGDVLKARLAVVERDLGPYPHAALSAREIDPARKKQGTRLVLLECSCEEPRKIRLSRTVAEQGAIVCGLCEGEFKGDLGEDEGAGVERAAANGGAL